MIQSPRVASATVLLVSVALTASTCLAAPPAIESFARRPHMQGVTISPDGRYVALLSGVGDETALLTLDRS
jgi:hypothetical protein